MTSYSPLTSRYWTDYKCPSLLPGMVTVQSLHRMGKCSHSEMVCVFLFVISSNYTSSLADLSTLENLTIKTIESPHEMLSSWKLLVALHDLSFINRVIFHCTHTYTVRTCIYIHFIVIHNLYKTPLIVHVYNYVRTCIQDTPPTPHCTHVYVRTGMYGQLGHGDKDKQVTPKVVEALTDKSIYLLACGNFHTVSASKHK